mgnify:CR=1 FL=1
MVEGAAPGTPHRAGPHRDGGHGRVRRLVAVVPHRCLGPVTLGARLARSLFGATGIEIANIGCYPVADTKVLNEWYRGNADGKVRMVLTPLVNHWWNVTLYVASRGLTTSPVPHGRAAFNV